MYMVFPRFIEALIPCNCPARRLYHFAGKLRIYRGCHFCQRLCL